MLEEQKTNQSYCYRRILYAMHGVWWCFFFYCGVFLSEDEFLFLWNCPVACFPCVVSDNVCVLSNPSIAEVPKYAQSVDLHMLGI
jgi:hypothetical protein